MSGAQREAVLGAFAGSVTQAAANGTEEWIIQEVTGHKSPAVLGVTSATRVAGRSRQSGGLWVRSTDGAILVHRAPNPPARQLRPIGRICILSPQAKYGHGQARLVVFTESIL